MLEDAEDNLKIDREKMLMVGEYPKNAVAGSVTVPVAADQLDIDTPIRGMPNSESADRFMQDRDYEEAIKYYTDAINEATFKNEPAFRYLAARSQAYTELRKYDKALMDALKCGETEPNSAIGFLRKCEALAGLGKLIEAGDAYLQGKKCSDLDLVTENSLDEIKMKISDLIDAEVEAELTSADEVDAPEADIVPEIEAGDQMPADVEADDQMLAEEVDASEASESSEAEEEDQPVEDPDQFAEIEIIEPQPVQDPDHPAEIEIIEPEAQPEILQNDPQVQPEGDEREVVAVENFENLDEIFRPVWEVQKMEMWQLRSEVDFEEMLELADPDVQQMDIIRDRTVGIVDRKLQNYKTWRANLRLIKRVNNNEITRLTTRLQVNPHHQNTASRRRRLANLNEFNRLIRQRFSRCEDEIDRLHAVRRMVQEGRADEEYVPESRRPGDRHRKVARNNIRKEEIARARAIHGLRQHQRRQNM